MESPPSIAAALGFRFGIWWLLGSDQHNKIPILCFQFNGRTATANAGACPLAALMAWVSSTRVRGQRETAGWLPREGIYHFSEVPVTNAEV